MTCALDGLRCDNKWHDHEQCDVDGRPTGERMTCADCGAYAHYDMALDDYFHDDAGTPPCFLIPSPKPNTHKE